MTFINFYYFNDYAFKYSVFLDTTKIYKIMFLFFVLDFPRHPVSYVSSCIYGAQWQYVFVPQK